MRLTRWPVLALLLAVGFLAMSGEASAQSLDAEEARFLELLNEYRAQNGLEPVLLSSPLSVASERHSEDMGTYGFFSHTTAQSSYYAAGSGHVERMAQEGYSYDTYTSENIAYGQPTAEAVFEAWRLSAGHNANMLGDYSVVGVGLVTVGGTPYWTTDFGAYTDPSAGGEAPPPPADPETAPQAAGPPDATADTPPGADDAQYAPEADGADDAQYDAAGAGADDGQYDTADEGTDDGQYAAGADDAQYAPEAGTAGSRAGTPDAGRDVAAAAPAAVPEAADVADAPDTRVGRGSAGGETDASAGMTTLPDTGGISPALLAGAALLAVMVLGAAVRRGR